MVKSYLEIPKKLFKKDILQLILVMLLLIVFLYFIAGFKAIFLFGLLTVFFFSKPEKDFFWIIIALILLDCPMNLFWHIQNKVFSFGIIKLSYIHIFSILSLVKVNVRPGYPKLSNLLKKPYSIYLIWLIFLLIYGAIVGIEGGGKTGYRYFYNFGKTFLVFPLFITIPKMLNNDKSLRRFINLIFFLVIINFIGQIISITLKQNIHLLLGGHIPEDWDSSIYYSKTELVRSSFGAYIHFFAFFTSMYYYFSNDINYNKRFLFFITAISYLSCIISASRGWAIAYTFFIILVFFYSLYRRKFLSTTGRTIILIIPLLILFFVSDITSIHFKKVLDRLSTVELLIKGDITAGGTMDRLTERHVPVMAKFYERPVTGWGFSKVGMDTWDGHVGNQSVLMIGGVIGFLIILYIWIYFIIKIFRVYNFVSLGNTYKNSLLIANFALLSLIIIHSTSAQVFGYYLYSSSDYGPLSISIFFSLINIFYYDALSKEKMLRK